MHRQAVHLGLTVLKGADRGRQGAASSMCVNLVITHYVPCVSEDSENSFNKSWSSAHTNVLANVLVQQVSNFRPMNAWKSDL